MEYKSVLLNQYQFAHHTLEQVLEGCDDISTSASRVHAQQYRGLTSVLKRRPTTLAAG